MRVEYRDLFEYAAGFVTPADVAAFAPNDPGYRNYVRAFNRILADGDVPAGRPGFDVTETIGLTRWHDPAREPDPARFRRFRVLTNAVGLAVSDDGEEELGENYLAIGLLDDAHTLGDRRLLELLVPAFTACHDWLRRDGWADTPFLTLGLLLVRAELGASDGELAELAERVMAEEAEHAGRASHEFLWGCTHDDQLNPLWRATVARMLVPSTGSATLLREALLAE